MGTPTGYGRCYVCKQRYPADDLGRMNLPLTSTKRTPRSLRVVCAVCFAGLWDALLATGKEQVLILHGY